MPQNSKRHVGEDLDPLSAAAIRKALNLQQIQIQANPRVDGSPSKRTLDALARAMAEDSLRADDAPDTLTVKLSADDSFRPEPTVSTAGGFAAWQTGCNSGKTPMLKGRAGLAGNDA